ncbi:hypothetical protein O9992_21980 [Vibrio lentus]|nr:hypothetical protein [Vibrio lentus]
MKSSLSQRDPATLPSNLRGYLASNQTQNALADKNGVAITINKGQESLEQHYGKYAYPKWQLPSQAASQPARLMLQQLLLTPHHSTQGSIVKAAEAYLTNMASEQSEKRKATLTFRNPLSTS